MSRFALVGRCSVCKATSGPGRACCGLPVVVVVAPEAPAKPRFGRGPRARIQPVNRERKARVGATAFSDQSRLVRTLPCCSCGKRPPSDPAHERSRGAGGKDRDCVPLCGGVHGCHRRQHDQGIQTFEAIQVAQCGGFSVGDVRCATLKEVASYCADMARDHLCYEYPEQERAGSIRCLVCHEPIHGEHEGLAAP